MRLSGTSGHSAGGLISQWGGNIKSPSWYHRAWYKDIQFQQPTNVGLACHGGVGRQIGMWVQWVSLLNALSPQGPDRPASNTTNAPLAHVTQLTNVIPPLPGFPPPSPLSSAGSSHQPNCHSHYVGVVPICYGLHSFSISNLRWQEPVIQIWRVVSTVIKQAKHRRVAGMACPLIRIHISFHRYSEWCRCRWDVGKQVAHQVGGPETQ